MVHDCRMPAVPPGTSGSAGLCWLAASRTPWGGFRAAAASAFSLEGGCRSVVGAGHRAVCTRPRRAFPLAVCSLGIRVGSFHFVYSLGFCSPLLISVFHKTRNGSNSQSRAESSLLPAVGAQRPWFPRSAGACCLGHRPLAGGRICLLCSAWPVTRRGRPACRPWSL